MILTLPMPRMGELMRQGVIDNLAIAEGSVIQPGSRLFDVRVNLGEAAPQDCPMVYYFRVVARERGWVRRVDVAVGDALEVGAPLALISTAADEPLDAPSARSLRVATAGILKDSPWPPPAG